VVQRRVEQSIARIGVHVVLRHEQSANFSIAHSRSFMQQSLLSWRVNCVHIDVFRQQSLECIDIGANNARLELAEKHKLLVREIDCI